MEDNNYDVDSSDLKEYKLPPHPCGIREWSGHDLRYSGDVLNFRKRLTHKLYNLWCSWASIVMNEDIKKQLEHRCEKDSPLYEARGIIVDMMDQLGKNLGDTDILEELAWLSTENELEFLEKVKMKRTRSDKSSSCPPE